MDDLNRKTFRCDGCGASISGLDGCDTSYLVHTFYCPENPHREHNLRAKKLLNAAIEKALRKASKKASRK